MLKNYRTINYFTDGVICVHNMRVYNFPVVSTIERTKGASLFSLDVKVF